MRGRNSRNQAVRCAKRSVYYEYDRYDIKEEYVPIVEAHSKFLMDHADLKIAVQGNCDDRGSREYNLALGQRRANSVKHAMVLLGVGDKQIETVSFGAEKPWPSVRTRKAGPRTGEPISFIRTNLSNVPAFRSYRRAAIAARFLLLFLWSMWEKSW
jgi:peptidoglycan-associated lipoprotein